MASVTACRPEPDAPSSSPAVPRDANDSQPEPGRVESLRGRSAFTEVLGFGSRRSRGPITVVVKPNHLGLSRVGLVAGRRVGGAVARNRAKRRIRHALARAGVPSGIDLVVIARPEVLTMAFQKLVAALEEGLGSAVEPGTRS